jgi:hypothetical protein
MKLTWYSIRSTDFYQNSFLPKDIIYSIPNKSPLYENDCDWTNDIFLVNYGNLYKSVIEKSPLDFGQGIQQQYQDKHFAKLKPNMTIRRLKCLIRQVDIVETDYKLDRYRNQVEPHIGT